MSNGNNDWNVGYGAIRFMEQVLTTHTAVETFERTNDIQFLIRRRKGMTPVNAVLVEQYEFGIASLYAVLQQFRGINVVVNNGNWNQIAFDRNDAFKNTSVIALSMNDFLGALHVDRLDQYVPRSERDARDQERRKTS